jgi:hypothetical protein
MPMVSLKLLCEPPRNVNMPNHVIVRADGRGIRKG